MMNSETSWLWWALLAALFAALTAVFGKIGVEAVPPNLAVWIRTAIILLVLAAILAARGEWSNPFALPAKSWLFLTFSALATGASWVCYFRALKSGDASKVAALDKLSVVLVAIFAAIFLHERPGFRGWIGIALMACGAVLVALRR